MGRLTYGIFLEGELLEQFDDLLDALPRSRALACRYERNYEVRNADDIIVAVALTTKRGESGAVMQRAARHNAKLGLDELRDLVGARKCPSTGTPHVWLKETEERLLLLKLWRCLACNVFGYRYAPGKVLPHHCSTCGRGATHIRPNKRVPHHRWSCSKHVEL